MGQVRTGVARLILGIFVLGCASVRDVDDARGGAGNAGANAVGGGGTSASEGGSSNANGAGKAGSNIAGADSGDAGESNAGAPNAGAPNAGAPNAGAGGESGSSGRYPLFNGVDFSGWDRYLGKPTDNDPALGLDNDPRGVYSIVMLDGEPAIRISGEIWGSLLSEREFCDFRLHAQYRWGTLQYTYKDSGIMFLSGGPLGAVNAGGNPLSDPIGSGAFMVSAEFQITPGDVGSLYNLGPVAFDQSLHSPGSEADPSQWNDVDITLQDDVASLVLNGHEVSRASGFVLNWPYEPATALRCGKLQLQSEGAEIFFRHVEIEELP